MTTVGVIPARGGSKRIPRKNIKLFHERPLIVRAVDTMQAAGIFDRIVVSTDDDEIAAIATSAGAEAPFRRPAELSDDNAGTGAVIRHAIEVLEAESSTTFDHVGLVYPGAVFITSADLREAFAVLVERQIDYVFSATTFPAPIERALALDGDGLCQMVDPSQLLTRSQDLSERYHDVGQFYLGRRDAWMASIPVMTGRSVLHEIPRWRVQDIDTPEDWTRAELLYELIRRSDS